jgi:D-amino-acid dehydrogenase
MMYNIAAVTRQLSYASRSGADVVVIGAGVVGVSVALELAARGASVTVLERGAAPGSGCSPGSAGIVGVSHVLPLADRKAVREGLRDLPRRDGGFALRPRLRTIPWLARFLLAAQREPSGEVARVLRTLAAESFARHQELARRFDVGFAQNGFLTVYETAAAFEEACAHISGPHEEVVDAAAARELCPQLASAPAGGIYAPDDAHCDPARFVAAMAGEAARTGVEIRAGVEVLGMRRRGDRVDALCTTAGDLPVGDVVVAAGAWSPAVAADLPIALPVMGGKGYHLDLAPDAGDTTMPVRFPERRIVATPMGDRMRLTGMLELVGTDMDVDRSRVRAIREHADRLLRGLGGRGVRAVWRGLRPCSPDGLPIVGRVPRAPNVVLATGHGMWGLQLAPVTARLVADELAGAPADDVARALRPRRFTVAPWHR